MTRHLKADPEGIAEAARLLREGALVAFPTETVYGLGAHARDPAAVAGIYRAKGRPSNNPLIVHVADLAAAEALGQIGARGRALAEAFWPGPLTLVVPLRDPGLAPAVTAGRATVGLRVPGGPVAQALMAAAGVPVAAPSANPSGRVSPTAAAHVLDPETGLAGRIAAVLDGGPTRVGLESTILALDGPQPRLLRPGGLTLEALTAVLGAPPLVAPAAPVATDETAPTASEAFEAPGMMASHYAPRARLRLDAARPRPGEAWLGFGADPAEAAAAPRSTSLSPAGDLEEAAARLFDALRTLDHPEITAIAVAPVPLQGLGDAINDRLRRAAAPRPPAETDEP